MRSWYDRGVRMLSSGYDVKYIMAGAQANLANMRAAFHLEDKYRWKRSPASPLITPACCPAYTYRAATGRGMRGRVTTFDLRLTAPNREPVMDTPAIHTIEHLGATSLRVGRAEGSDLSVLAPWAAARAFI